MPTDRTGKTPLTAIRVEIWRGDHIISARLINFARDEDREWLRRVQIWAWSTGLRVVTLNTSEVVNEPGAHESLMATSGDKQSETK